jgi:hypothetical protein
VYDLDEKTQAWQHRTHQLWAAAPIRGGLVPDHRARRQTAASVAFVLLTFLLLILLAPRLRSSVPESVVMRLEDRPARIRILTTFPAPPSFAPLRSALPSVVSAPSMAAPAPSLPKEYHLPQEIPLPLPGRVPPMAPTWLDGPPYPGYLFLRPSALQN